MCGVLDGFAEQATTTEHEWRKHREYYDRAAHKYRQFYLLWPDEGPVAEGRRVVLALTVATGLALGNLRRAEVYVHEVLAVVCVPEYLRELEKDLGVHEAERRMLPFPSSGENWPNRYHPHAVGIAREARMYFTLEPHRRYFTARAIGGGFADVLQLQSLPEVARWEVELRGIDGSRRTSDGSDLLVQSLEHEAGGQGDRGGPAADLQRDQR